MKEQNVTDELTSRLLVQSNAVGGLEPGLHASHASESQDEEDDTVYEQEHPSSYDFSTTSFEGSYTAFLREHSERPGTFN